MDFIIIYNLNLKEKTLFTEKIKQMGLQGIIVNYDRGNEVICFIDILKSRLYSEKCYCSKNDENSSQIKTGIYYVYKNYPECRGYITVDAKYEYDIDDIIKVIEIYKNNPNKFVIGIRDYKAIKLSLKKRLAKYVSDFLFLLNTGKRCKDLQTHLRAIPKSLTETCLLTTDKDYEYDMNLMIKIMKKKTTLMSIPVTARYLGFGQSSCFYLLQFFFKTYFNIYKYSLSSFISAAVDLSLFYLFNIFFGSGTNGILASTVLARIISGNINFILNKYWVFKSNNNIIKEFPKYITLFCIQMMFSWGLVSLLSSLPLPILFIKILVDALLFIFRYLIQNKYIFNDKEEIKNI